MSDQQVIIQFKHGAGATTNWNHYNLDQIWAMVAREDSTITAAQVQAWQRMAELCTDQAGALQRALGQLMARWRPHPGSSAQAFQARMTYLITSMRDSARAASSIPDPLWRISNQLTIARYEILALIEQRAKFEEAEAAQDLTHGYNGRGAPPRPPSSVPPPPDNWRTLLDLKARHIMAATESALNQAAAAFRPIAAFGDTQSISARRPVGTDDEVAASGGPSPFGIDLHPASTRSQLPASAQERSLGVEAPNESAPVLSGGTQLDPPAPGVPSTTARMLSLSHSSNGSFDTIPSRETREVIGLEPAGQSMAARASGESAPSRFSSPTSQSPMVTPVAGRTGGDSRPSLQSGMRRRTRRHHDDAWGAREGLPPVIEPGPEPTFHDPGPGVIGIDR